MADEGKTPAPGPQPPPVDTSGMTTFYANFVRGTWTPEELMLDFGLSMPASSGQAEPVKLTHRLVVNFYTAKRMLGLLHAAIQQHEQVYGPVEVDVHKRARSPSGRG